MSYITTLNELEADLREKIAAFSDTQPPDELVILLYMTSSLLGNIGGGGGGGDGSGGVQYDEGTVDPIITGTAMMWEDTGNTLRTISADTPLPTKPIVTGAGTSTDYLTVRLTDGTDFYAAGGGGGGSTPSYTEGDTDATISGVAFLWEDTANTLRVPSASKPLPVELKNTSIAVTSASALNVSGSVSVTGEVDVTPTSPSASSYLPVRITDGTSFANGSIQYTEGDTDSSITGNAILWEDAANTLVPVSTSKALPVNVTNNITATVTGVATETTLSSIDAKLATEDTLDFGGSNFVAIKGLALPGVSGPVAGGTNTNPIRIDPTGSTTQPVSGTVGISGTVTAALNQTSAGSFVSVRLTDGTSFLTNLPVSQSGSWVVGQSGSWNVGQSGTWNINNISGTISLPTGAATESTLSTISGKLPALVGGKIPVEVSGIDVNVTNTALEIVNDAGNPIPVNGTVSVGNFPSTQAVTQSGTWNLTNISGTISLPTGAATESTLSTASSTLTTINGKMPSTIAADRTAATAPFAVRLSDGTNFLTSLAVTQSGTWNVGQSGTWNINNISGTISLPTGAATESTLSTLNGKIPSNLTVSSTRLLVDGSGVTQPVSGTLTANIGTTNGLALDATLTGGTQKAITRGGAKGSTTAADVTSTSVDANTQALDVSIKNTALATNISQYNGSSVGASNAFHVQPGTSATWTLNTRHESQATPLAVRITQDAATFPSTLTVGSNNPTAYRATNVNSSKISVSATQAALLGWALTNTNTYPVYLKLYNTAIGSVTVGTTTPALTLEIPAQGSVVYNNIGTFMYFGTAITIACTTESADNGTTGPANSLITHLMYR